MSNFDVGIRKHVELGQVQYWLLITAKSVEPVEDEDTVKVRKLCPSVFLNFINSYYWKIFIIFTVIINVSLYVSYYWMGTLFTFAINIIVVHTTDFFYWIDYIGAVIEVPKTKKKKVKTTKIISLVVDGVSLLPLSILYIIFSPAVYVGTLWMMRSITLLRFYRIPRFFSRISNAERNHWKILMTTYAGYMILFTFLFANYFLYSIHSFVPFDIKNWDESPQTKVVISLYYAIQTILNISYGDIKPDKFMYQQMFVTCIAMIVGAAVMTGLFTGILATTYTNRGKRREHYRYEYEATVNALNERKIDKKVLEKVRDNMLVLWKYKEGFTDVTSPVHVLPLTLQKEICFDINFGFLNRSLLFSMRPRSFLRSVSLFMKNMTYLPGDIILEPFGTSDAMFCVASGVIEVLSEENDESVLFSLTTGTILGEATLFISIPIRCIIRASTYVELQVLMKVHFSRLALIYPEIFRTMRMEIEDRLHFAEQMTNFANASDNVDLAFQEVIRRKETKKFLKNLREFHKENNRDSAVSILKTDILGLYVLSENIPRVKTLPINLIRAKPWIIRPNTSLTKFWNTFMAVVIVFVVIAFPMWTAFHRTIKPYMNTMLILANIIYVVDLYIECTTAIERKDHFTYITSMKEIIAYKLKTVGFYLDILSTYHLSVYADLVWPSHESYAYLLLSLNTTLKLWRLIFYLNQMQNSIKNNLLLVITVKYIIYFAILVVWAAVLLYLEACPVDTCYTERWFGQLEIKAAEERDKMPNTASPLAVSLYFASITVFSVGYGDIVPTTVTDCVVVIICAIVGASVMVLCIAEASAAFKHLASIRTTYQEEIFAVNRFMADHEIPKFLQVKVRTYLRLQWDYDKGYSLRSNESSEGLYSLQKRIILMELTKAFLTVPLFQDVNPDFVKLLARLCKVRVIPPNEDIVVAGSFVRAMYIIENGYCQLHTIGPENVKRIAGPMTPFGYTEMITGGPHKQSVQTLTHVRVISLDYLSYLKAITKYPGAKMKINDILDTLVKSKNVSFDSLPSKTSEDPKIKDDTITKLQNKIISKAFINVYKYHKTVRTKYWEPFHNWGKLRFLQILMLPIAIRPDCLFLKIWMSLRIINAIILAFFSPIQFWFPNHSSELITFITVQQAFAAVDVYFMFHIAYYDERGLLMFHPAKTAARYLKGSFILDLITAFPYSLVTWAVLSKGSTTYNYLSDTPALFMILQLYKFFQGCYHLEQDILKKTDQIKILKFIPLSIVIANVISGFMILLQCYQINQTGEAELHGYTRMATEYVEAISTFCLNSPQRNRTSDKMAFRMYITTLYWVTTTMSGLGYGDITAHNEHTMIAVIIVVILGIFLYAFMFASITSSMVNTNVLITKHRARILKMSKFLKKKKVPLSLQRRLVLHYEYNWQRTEGATPQKILTRVNEGLRNKLIASMYEDTVRQIPGFEYMEQIVIKILGKNLDELYFLRGETIVKFNDIQTYIYLIYRGQVNLYREDGTLITTMGQGGLFGNISNKPFSVSSEIVSAAENVDLLRIDCKLFFQSLQVFPNTTALIAYLMSRDKNYIEPKQDLYADDDTDSFSLKLNLFQIQTMPDITPDQRSDLYSPERHSFYLNHTVYIASGRSKLSFVILPGSSLHNAIVICVFMGAYISVVLNMYMFAFHDMSVYALTLSYFLDCMFAIEMFLKFHISYFDKFGDCVVNRRKIRERYVKSSAIIVDLASNLPIEIVAVLNLDFWQEVFLTCRLNRIIRAYQIFDFYKQKLRNLMINKIYLQIGWITIVLSLMIHSLACLWFFAVCPYGNYLEPTWVTEMDLLKREKWELYFYCAYHVVILTTSAGLQELPTYSEQELLFNTIFVTVTRVTEVILAGLLAAAINAQSLNLFLFQDSIAELKLKFLRQNISEYQIVKMWNYLTTLWQSETGKQIPKFISIAPYSMKCDVMYAMFGSHLSQCFVFSGLDETFLRQVAVHLRRFVFFPENYIVQQGDIDDTMYFIHQGEVAVLTIQPDLMETIHFTLIENDCFGIRQGLIIGKAHHFSYRAETNVEIVSLTHSHWQHLLKYFPKVEEKIYKKLELVP